MKVMLTVGGGGLDRVILGHLLGRSETVNTTCHYEMQRQTEARKAEETSRTIVKGGSLSKMVLISSLNVETLKKLNFEVEA